MIEITWCGHSYVVLRDLSRDMTIAIDPHDGLSVGLPLCKVSADIVLVTHNHYDHNAVEVAKKPGSVVLEFARGRRVVNGVEIEGFVFYHDKSRGSLRGMTASYCLKLGDYRICHLGDIGHVPEDEQLSSLKRADLVFIPVGGVYTIDASEAWTLTQKLEPKLVMPIHYWLPGSLLPLDPLDRFLDIFKGQRVRLNSNELTLPTQRVYEKVAVVIPELKTT